MMSKWQMANGRWLRGLGICALVFACCFPAFAEQYLAPSNSPPVVTLEWDASPGTNNIAGYNIYYGTASRAYTSVLSAGTNLTLTVAGLLRDYTYYFAATAVDDYGLESDFSDEVSWAVPRAPAPPVLHPVVVLTVQAKPSIADGIWEDSGMAWSLRPQEATQVFRLRIQ